MNIVLLNWTGGENDPFSYFNACLKQGFEQLGRPTRIVNTSNGFEAQLMDAYAQGIDFALTWQGLGMDAGSGPAHPSTVWDDLKIPLLSIHGDHPSHAPGHHKAMSPWVRHLYQAPSFASFANRYIPRKHPATYLPFPVLFPNTVQDRFDGDFFVIPKNRDDNAAQFEAWRRAPQHRTGAFLLAAADAIITEFANGNRRNHHDVIEALLKPETIGALQAELGANSELMVRMHVHSLLDKVHRNAIADHIVDELSNVPLHIYGRGWESFKARGNPKHEFLTFDVLSDNSFQFASNYGVLDIAPINDSLHDRTYRAIGNRSSFLIGSNWPHASFLGNDFSDLFFDGARGALAEKTARIMSDPKAHRERSREFAAQYRTNFSFFNFLKCLESVAATVRPR